MIPFLFPSPCSPIVSKKPASPVLPGESLSLVCNAESSNGKKPQIYWLDPQGEKIISGSPKVTVTDQSNGLWTCVVKNNEKQTEAKISVTVMSKLLCACIHICFLE